MNFIHMLGTHLLRQHIFFVKKDNLMENLGFWRYVGTEK